MHLRNKTQYPDDEVRELIRFATADIEGGSKKVITRLAHTKAPRSRRDDWSEWGYPASGRAHNFIYLRPDAPRSAQHEVHLRLGRPDDFPVRWYDKHGEWERAEVSVEMSDWREALVAIAAHEFKHIEDYRLGRRGTSRDAECRCEAYAAYAVRRYREA